MVKTENWSNTYKKFQVIDKQVYNMAEIYG